MRDSKSAVRSIEILASIVIGYPAAPKPGSGTPEICRTKIRLSISTMAAAVVVAAVVRNPLAQEPMRSPAPPKGATLRRGRRNRLQAGYVLLHRPPPKQQSSEERAAADSLYCSAREVKADKTSLNTV